MMMTLRSRGARGLLFPVLIFGLVGCGEVSQAGWAGMVRDSAGVMIVENPADPLDAAVLVYAPELSIGNDESVPETLFGHVVDAASDSRGRIYVLDQQARVVRAFNPDGTFLTSLGGPGQGPGELGQLATSLMLTGDTVVVADWVNARLTRWGPDYELLPGQPLPISAPARSWWRRGPTTRSGSGLSDVPLMPRVGGGARITCFAGIRGWRRRTRL